MTPLKTFKILSLAIVGGAVALSLANANPGDYDPVTGEPKCTNCHTPDRKYSIDYSRDETCAECHGPGLSQKFLNINDRYEHKAKAEPAIEPSENKPVQLAAADKKKTEGAAGKPAKRGGKYDEMVLVPAGEFTMGSNDWWPKSQPEHKRELKAYYIDKYEVTNARYKAMVDAGKKPAPTHWTGGKIPKGKENHPVVFVSWQDAKDFCEWEGKHLPTEAQWEKAARGTDKRAFPWGDKFDKNKGNTPQYGNEDTMPVGSFEDGKSPYGLYDMAGNAWEWVDDWFKPYPGNSHPDENYGEKYKVLRGGSWYDCTYYKCGISAPSYNKIFFHPGTKNNNFGFRCAKDK